MAHAVSHGRSLPDLDDDVPKFETLEYAVAIGPGGEAEFRSLEAQNLQQIMPHEWDPMFSPVPLLRNEQRDPDGAAAADEQADVEDDEGTTGTTEATDSSVSNRSFSFTFRQHVSGSTPIGALGIGTPSIALNMILDTGSDKFVAKTWATIKAELEKIDAGASDEVFPGAKIYNHNASKSYVQLYASQNGSKVPRQGFIAYGSGMAITLEGRETIRIGDDEKFVSMQKFPISEISLDSLQILHSSKGISGILGLQHMMNRSLGQSFYSVLRDKTVLHSFGYCRGKNNDGFFVWGDQSLDGKAVNVVGQMHWAVKLKNMHVQKKRPQAASLMERFDARISDADSLLEEETQNHTALKFHLCHKSSCVAVIDTGSNIIAMPNEAVRSLSKMLDVQTDCSNLAQLPNLHFVLGEDMHISLPPSAYIMKVKLPRLKEPKPGEASGEASEASTSFSGAQLAQTEMGSESLDQAIMESFLEDTFREHGLDLRALQVDLMALRNSSTLCMPAIVPLDRETQKGTLMVVGGPLFEKYYTRWAWPKGKMPQIYLKHLHKAEACLVKEVDSDSSSSSAPKMTVWRAHDGHDGRMIRAEKVKPHHGASHPAELNENDAETRLREMTLDEIRYPHWAKDLEDL